MRASRRMAASNRNRLLPISAIFVRKSGRPDFRAVVPSFETAARRARPPQDEVRIFGRSTPLRAGGERRNEIHVAGVTSPLRRASALLRHLVVVAAFERDPVGLQV